MSSTASIEIHPTAVVSPNAVIGEGVTIGPHTVIGDEVSIGSGCFIGPGTLIEGPTVIGRNNKFHGHAAVGTDPQDLKYDGSPTRLEIGDDNQIREFVTLNRGTAGGGGETRIGSRNLLMTGVPPWPVMWMWKIRLPSELSAVYTNSAVWVSMLLSEDTVS
jgi:UDP-N-acetylglucosamine acyltransferase